jgi:hypothetical protein
VELSVLELLSLYFRQKAKKVVLEILNFNQSGKVNFHLTATFRFTFRRCHHQINHHMNQLNLSHPNHLNQMRLHSLHHHLRHLNLHHPKEHDLLRDKE